MLRFFLTSSFFKSILFFKKNLQNIDNFSSSTTFSIQWQGSLKSERKKISPQKEIIFFFQARSIINTGKVLLFVGSSRCEGSEIVGWKKMDWKWIEWTMNGFWLDWILMVRLTKSLGSRTFFHHIDSLPTAYYVKHSNHNHSQPIDPIELSWNCKHENQSISTYSLTWPRYVGEKWKLLEHTMFENFCISSRFLRTPFVSDVVAFIVIHTQPPPPTHTHTHTPTHPPTHPPTH